MVVPILEKEQTIRRYYVPKGNWTNLQTMQTISGGRWTQDSSISMGSIPVFAKEGAFIPMAADIQNTAAYNEKMITIHYFPSSKPSTYEWYEDDGEDANAINKKAFELTRFSCTGVGKTTTIEISSNGGKYLGQKAKRKFLISIPHFNQNVRIYVNGILYNKNAIQQTHQGIAFPVEFAHKKLVIRMEGKAG
jgi:alpha-glucosidase (family GH31 glycosyl hydrolase)